MMPRSARIPRAPRLAAALLLGLAALVATPRPARAIFGVGDVVYDPANHANAKLRYAQLILQANQLGRQLEVATRQANHAIDQARGFRIGRLRIPSVGQLLDRVDGRYGGGATLGYGNRRLEALFQRTFPDAVAWSHHAAGAQAAAAREAAYHLLLGARDQHLQMRDSRRRLDELKLDLASAGTEREVAQIQNRIAAEQLDQQLIGRSMEMGTANLQAVDVALRAGRAAREAMGDTARAVLDAHQQDVHEAARRRVEARQDGIARARDARRRAPYRP
jgi:hypothetical protein